MGRLMGLEPTTTRSTIWCSAIELQAPYCATAALHSGSASLGVGWGTGIRTPIDGSKVRSPAVRRSPTEVCNNTRGRSQVLSCQGGRPVHDALSVCRDPDLNWGHQHFQCCALPTELSRRDNLRFADKRSACWGPTFVHNWRERAMRFELTTFSLARRRSTTELRPHVCC